MTGTLAFWRENLRSARRDGADSGMGLILVVCTSTVVMSLVLVAGAIAMRSQVSAREHTMYDDGLVSAEQGVDLGLARVAGEYNLDGSTYLSPHATATTFDATPDCTASTVAFPASAGVSAAAERTWARAQLTTLATLPGCLHTGPQGQYTMLAPSGRQAVYALGWSPTYAAYVAKKGRARMIKTEYLFSPYKPTNAVLTGGDLEIDSSTTVTTAPGVDPTLAAVHSNGNITVDSGNPTVTGPVTQSGSGSLHGSNNFPGGAATLSAKQTLPRVSSLAVYNRNVADYLGAGSTCAPTARCARVPRPDHARARSSVTTGLAGPTPGAFSPTGGPTTAHRTRSSGWSPKLQQWRLLRRPGQRCHGQRSGKR